MGRQKILQKIRRFDLHAAQIRQPGAAALAIQLAEAAEEPLDADEIPFRMPPGVIGEKRSVAAAEFHFERPGLGEKLRQIERFDDGMQFHNQILRRAGLSFQIGNRQSKIVI